MVVVVVATADRISKFPTELRDTGFIVNIAEIGKTHRKIIILGFQFMKSTIQKNNSEVGNEWGWLSSDFVVWTLFKLPLEK